MGIFIIVDDVVISSKFNSPKILNRIL